MGRSNRHRLVGVDPGHSRVPVDGDAPAALVRPTLQVFQAVEPLAEQWEELADRVDASPFLRPGWIQAWQRAFGTGRLEIVALWQGARLAALIPLHRAFGRFWSTSNWHTPQFGMLAKDAVAARELATALFRRRPIELSLGFLDAAGPELPLCRAAAAGAGYRTLERTLQRSPYVAIDGTWDGYVRRLKRKRWRDLDRRRRLLEEQGRLCLEIHDGGQQLGQLLDEAFEVEALGWKGANRTAILSQPETVYFYTEVARWAADQGWLEIAFLRLDGRPLAVSYNLRIDGNEYDLKAGYDPAFGWYSPGRLLLLALIERAFATGVRRLWLLGADEPYKATFATGYREYVRFQAFAPSAAGWLDWAAFAVGRPAAKRLLAARRRGDSQRVATSRRPSRTGQRNGSD
jgi:CelD/BcsL family acetyltransferase involved in cellulose biosynthesis